MTDSYLINSATFVVCFVAAASAWGGIAQLLTAIGLPGGFASFVGFVAGVAAFFAVLYGYYLLFLAHEDEAAEQSPEVTTDGTADADVVGTRSFRK